MITLWVRTAISSVSLCNFVLVLADTTNPQANRTVWDDILMILAPAQYIQQQHNLHPQLPEADIWDTTTNHPTTEAEAEIIAEDIAVDAVHAAVFL